MIPPKRRLTLILVSVTIGSILSALLMISRKQTLDITDYATLTFNTLIAFGLVLGVVYMLNKKSKDQKPKV